MENDVSALQNEVERLARSKPFGVVEDFIEALSVDEPRKAALWLLAWSYVSPDEQRRVAYEVLGAWGR
jgi:hypothetical protein